PRTGPAKAPNWWPPGEGASRGPGVADRGQGQDAAGPGWAVAGRLAAALTRHHLPCGGMPPVVRAHHHTGRGQATLTPAASTYAPPAGVSLTAHRLPPNDYASECTRYFLLSSMCPVHGCDELGGSPVRDRRGRVADGGLDRQARVRAGRRRTPR